MFKRLTTWWKETKRADNRTRSIDFRISIPYNEHNETALRGLKVGAVELLMTDAVGTISKVSLEKVTVKCVANPDWRG
jgi:hypothetical protein